MVCTGPSNISPSRLESEAAQLRILEWFRPDFLGRHPTGIVLSEYEYMGRTTSAPRQPGPLRTSNRDLNATLDGLATNFRNWEKDRDFRKCDVLGISGDGRYAEMLEITTESNAASAIAQVNAKLAILRITVNKLLNRAVDWRPSPWRPTGDLQIFMQLPAAPGEFRWVCYMPTYRRPAPEGVVLYEIHALKRTQVPVPVPVPKELTDKIKNRAERVPVRKGFEQQWARDFLIENPALKTVLKALMVVAAIGLIIVAIVAIFDPVPGDEAAAYLAAMALLQQATK
ncbi:MAG TPA: hypothetical protein VG672_20360 [Bryobacteraceae bacterium]|nr:hypothetical protein [Bryobacteraceae bacterium]